MPVRSRMMLLLQIHDFRTGFFSYSLFLHYSCIWQLSNTRAMAEHNISQNSLSYFYVLMGFFLSHITISSCCGSRCPHLSRLIFGRQALHPRQNRIYLLPEHRIEPILRSPFTQFLISPSYIQCHIVLVHFKRRVEACQSRI